MHRGLPGRRSARAGFTILELLLALLALALLASLAIPLYFERDAVTLENASLQLAQDLRRAQNRAAYMGETTRLVFYDDGDGYRIESQRGRPGSPEYVRRYSVDGVFEGVRVRELRLSSCDSALTFGPNGRSSTGGEILLAFGSHTRLVRVQPGTGRIEILGSTSGFRDDGL